MVRGRFMKREKGLRMSRRGRGKWWKWTRLQKCEREEAAKGSKEVEVAVEHT